MGLFSYFRDRREREGALSDPAAQDAIEKAIASQQDATESAQAGQPSGFEALGMIAAMFGDVEKMKAQGVDFDSQVIDMRGSGLREEILGVMSAHGVDSNNGGEVHASEDLQRDIMAALQRAGVPVDLDGMPTGMPASADAEPEEPIDPTVPQIRNPFDR